jgi:hypothetical protein
MTKSWRLISEAAEWETSRKWRLLGTKTRTFL